MTKFRLSLLVLPFAFALAACDQSAGDIRGHGELDSITLNSPYSTASECVATAIAETYDADITVQTQKHPPRTLIKKHMINGGYFVEVTPLSKSQSKVAVYTSVNAVLFAGFSAPGLLDSAKEKCSK